jgi:RNA polymerase sigma-70 factor (ECF subfamily)
MSVAPAGPPVLSFPDEMVAQLPDLRAYAASLTGSAVDADDLVQDAMVRIWRYRAAYQPEASLRGWMFRVLRNEYFTQRRRRAPWVEDVTGRFSELQVCGPAQEWSLQWRELLEALRGLPAANRQALLLVVALGCSYAEAARICGCDVQTLKGRVHRARSRLAKLTGWESLMHSRVPARGLAIED